MGRKGEGRLNKGMRTLCQIGLCEEWKKHNPYRGKRFSILGDSISTLEGYNPLDYAVFYKGYVCGKTGIKRKEDTWWGALIEYVGGELLVNDSWSGSRVTKMPEKNEFFPSGCSAERTGGLHKGSVQPDVIIIYLGTNDWAYGVQCRREGKMPKEGDIGCLGGYFDQAYRYMLQSVRKNYPQAEIWCCTINSTFMASDPDFTFPRRFGGTDVEEFNQVIRHEAKSQGCRLLDFYSFQTPYDAVDGTHPTKAGMDTLAALAVLALAGV